MRKNDKYLFTIVVLTYKRINVLLELLDGLSKIKYRNIEVIIVDNASHDGTVNIVKEKFPEFRIMALEKNHGAVARNKGIDAAKGKFIVTIDDDILGLYDVALDNLKNLFDRNPLVGAICFKVTDYYTGKVCNWCHPNKLEKSSDHSFETTEITEGAVAFRKEMLRKTGLYTEELFISHEGADLAARILNKGYEIYYTPLVCVNHKYAKEARDKWRRHYYDTRNDFWLAIRNYQILYAINHLLRRLPKTFFYSVRDGYAYYWVKAVKDAFSELPIMIRQRRPISLKVHRKMRYLNRNRPGFIYYFKKRFFSKQVRI